MITGRSLWASHLGITIVEAGDSFHVQDIVPPGVNPPIAVLFDTVTITDVTQITFQLAVTPQPGAVSSIVTNRKTYFPPDFTLVGDLLTWHGVSLELGQALHFESIGGGLAAGQFRLEHIIVTGDRQTTLSLDGTPLGDVAEVYIDGLCYPQSEGHFDVKLNQILWKNPIATLNTTNKVYVLYARTVDSSRILAQETFSVNPTSSPVFDLHVPLATPPRLYRRGLRYFNGADYTLASSLASLLDPAFTTGDRVSFMCVTSPAILPGTPPSDGPTTFFQANTVTPIDNAANVIFTGLPSYQSKSILSLDGLSYVQGNGYTLAGGTLSWDGHPALKSTDRMRLMTFTDALVNAAFQITILAPGQPLVLPTATPAPSKVFAIIASDSTPGGLLMDPQDLNAHVDGRTFDWIGALTLKLTDRVVLVSITDAAIAAAVNVERTTVGVGGALSWTLARQPQEIAFCTLNNLQLVMGDDITVTAGHVAYSGAVPLKQGDQLMMLYF